MVLGRRPHRSVRPQHKPIRTVEDLKGLKFRTLGNWAAILKDGFGAAPVVVPGSELYGMLEKKAIDAMEYSMPSENKALGFQEIARYVIMPGIHAGAWTFEAASRPTSGTRFPRTCRKDPSGGQDRDLREPELDHHAGLRRPRHAAERQERGHHPRRHLQEEGQGSRPQVGQRRGGQGQGQGNPWPEQVAKSIFDFQDRWEKYSPYLVVDHPNNFAKK